MSTAKPMRPIRRAIAYTLQNDQQEYTPAQRRRMRHKTNKILGAGGPGKVTPKRAVNRPVKPAPHGLPMWGGFAARKAKRIKWLPEAIPGDMRPKYNRIPGVTADRPVIIDDLTRVEGSGDNG